MTTAGPVEWIEANWRPDLTLGDWWDRLFDAGYAFPAWPAGLGGSGAGPAEVRAVSGALASAGVIGPPAGNGPNMGGPTVLAHGTREQQDRFVAPMGRGKHQWCQLFSEPGAGSDLGSLQTKAVADGDTFVVSGQKVWCSGGRYSDWGILMARTDQTAPKHKGISFFLFDMKLPGVDIRPLKQMTGEAEFDEVFFDDVRIPASSLLGPLHGGWMVGMATLTNERGSIGTASISLGRRMDKLIGQLRAAADDGDGIDGVTRDSLMKLVSTGRAMTMLAGRQGPSASTASSLLKLGITELSFASAEARVGLAGPQAMLAGNDAIQGLLAAPGGRIAGGTSQIQRNLIGERLLGLPAEPKPAKA